MTPASTEKVYFSKKNAIKNRITEKKQPDRKNHQKKQQEKTKPKKTGSSSVFFVVFLFFVFSCFWFSGLFFCLLCFLMKPHILYAVGLIRLIDRWSCWPSPGFIKPMVSRAHKRCLGLGCNLLQRKPQKAQWSMQSYKNDRLASVDCRSSRVSKPISMRQVESDFPWVCS